MTISPWNLLEANQAMVRAQSYEVAVLPLGATEPHNLHLPYGADVFEANLFGERICGVAWDRGAKVVLLPTIPYGTETNLREFPLAMNLNPSTLNAVVTDLVESLAKNGIRKILLLNSHGGNEMKPLLRELYGAVDASIFLCNWYQTCRDFYDEIFSHPEDHAGEMETSLLLAYRPELVARNSDGGFAADEGAMRPTRFAAINQGWVSISRPFHLLTTNCGAGNPHEATAEKGEQLIERLVERLATFVVELSAAPRDEQFPF